MEDTKWRIMNAAIELIQEKGYTATTTKDIARKANVNECTLFRKFQSKKDIILNAMKEDDFRPNLTEESFLPYAGDLRSDLEMFARVYLEQVRPEHVKLSIGLRVPKLYEEVKDSIMNVPQVFKKKLEEYFVIMKEQGKIAEIEVEGLTSMFLSSCFGYLFINASFGEKLISLNDEEYIKNSVDIFVSGIESKQT